MSDTNKRFAGLVGDAAVRMVLVHAEGSRAHREGLKIADSPYMLSSAEHWVWRDGYIHSFRTSMAKPDDSLKGK